MILLKNAKILTMTDDQFDNGFILIKDGKIIDIGDMKNVPSDIAEANTIDILGRNILPGFIDAHSHLGMSEDGVGDEGEDINEMSEPVTPQVRAMDAIDPRDKCFAEALEYGVTTSVVSPGSSNPIAGEIVAIKHIGHSVDEMIIKEFSAMKFALGENPKKIYGLQEQAPMSRMAVAALIRENLFKAQKYMQAIDRAEEESDLPEFEFKYESLIPVLKKEAQAHFHSHRAYDIQTAIRIAEEFDLDYVVVHGTEGFRISEFLSSKNAKVLCGPIMTTRTKPELSNQSMNNVGELIRAGVDVAVATDHPEVPVQYLALTASLLVSHGISREEALRAITSIPAKILGLENKIGSIKKGLDADLLVYNEDPLAINSKPDMIFINGKQVK